MTEFADQTHELSQPELYEQWMGSYQSSLEELNATQDAVLTQGVESAYEAVENDGMEGLMASAKQLDALSLSQMGERNEAIWTGRETLDEVVDDRDAELFNKAMNVFLAGNIDKAYKLIDRRSNNATTRRTLRTAMDPVTNSRMHHAFFPDRLEELVALDMGLAQEIHDFVANAASSEAARVTMQLGFDHLFGSLLIYFPGSTLEDKQATVNFIDATATTEASRQALRFRFDSTLFRGLMSGLRTELEGLDIDELINTCVSERNQDEFRRYIERNRDRLGTVEDI